MVVTCFLKTCTSLHIKFSAVANLAEVPFARYTKHVKVMLLRITDSVTPPPKKKRARERGRSFGSHENFTCKVYNLECEINKSNKIRGEKKSKTHRRKLASLNDDHDNDDTKQLNGLKF
jgi:hypothetical protein